MRRQFFRALIIVAALAAPLAAQRTVSHDLNGVWQDSRGNDVQVTHNGTSVSFTFRSGAVFSGTLHANKLELKHTLSFEETRKNLPLEVRQMITGREVAIRGTVGDSGEVIAATYYDQDPEWEKTPDGSYRILNYREGSRPMNFFRGELKIAEVNIDYTPWEIAQVETKRRLQRAKDDMERSERDVAARTQELEQARAALAPKERELAAIKRQFEQAQALATSTGPPERQKTRLYKQYETRLQRNLRRQDQLYDRIVNARQYSSNIPPEVVQRMIADYESVQAEEKEIRAQLKRMQDQMGYTAQVQGARERAQALDDAYFEAYKNLLHNELSNFEMAEKRLQWAAEERNKAQVELTAAQQAFDALNPADSPLVRALTAASQGTNRYEAEYWSPDVLEQLDNEIKELSAAVRELGEMRQRRRAAFLRDGEEAIAATEMFRRGIIKSAGAQALIETGFNVWDVLEKGAEGGPFAALAEASKKGVEALIFGAPTFAEPQIQAEFYSFSIDDPKKVASTLGKRGAKSALTGPVFKQAASNAAARYVRDQAAETLRKAEQQFFTSVGWPDGAYVDILRKRDALEAAEERVVKAAQATSGMRNRARDLIGNVKKAFWDKDAKSWVKKSSAATGLVKDVAKAQFKQFAADFFEGEALVNAMQADMQLQASTRLLLHVSSAYWDTKDMLEFKNELRQEILAQYDPKNHFNVKTNTTFRAGTELVITLTTLDGRAANHEMEVTVGGKRAQRAGADALRFTVRTDGVQKDANGGVKLDIRVLR